MPENENDAARIQREFDEYKAANPPPPAVDVSEMTKSEFENYKRSIVRNANRADSERRSAKQSAKWTDYQQRKKAYMEADPKTRGAMPQRPQ